MVTQLNMGLSDLLGPLNIEANLQEPDGWNNRESLSQPEQEGVQKAIAKHKDDFGQRNKSNSIR
jgi:hypothetical protein